MLCSLLWLLCRKSIYRYFKSYQPAKPEIWYTVNIYTVTVIKNKETLINSLTAVTKKQTTKFSSANFQKMLSTSNIILRIHRLVGKQCRSR